MTFAQKLAVAKTVRVILILALVAIAFKAISALSYGYCHGSSHNARGYYCETVYQNEDGYRAMQ